MSPPKVGVLLYIIVSATISDICQRRTKIAHLGVQFTSAVYNIRSHRSTRLQRIPKLETLVRLPSTALPINYCGEYEFSYRKYRRDSSPTVALGCLPVATATTGGITDGEKVRFRVRFLAIGQGGHMGSSMDGYTLIRVYDPLRPELPTGLTDQFAFAQIPDAEMEPFFTMVPGTLFEVVAGNTATVLRPHNHSR